MGGKARRKSADHSGLIHEAVMALLPEERRDREKVNEAVRDGNGLGTTLNAKFTSINNSLK
jgi:hypothetical protein